VNVSLIARPLKVSFTRTGAVGWVPEGVMTLPESTLCADAKEEQARNANRRSAHFMNESLATDYTDDIRYGQNPCNPWLNARS
jgi:hypothetical protein